MSDGITPLTQAQFDAQKQSAANENFIERDLVALDTAANVLTGGLPDETISSALGHVNATVADTQQAVHAWLHPSWPRKMWNGIQSFGVDVGRVLF